MVYYYDQDPETDDIVHQTFIAQSKTMEAIKGNKECGELALEILNIMAHCGSYDFPAVILFGLYDYDNDEENDNFEYSLSSAIGLLVRYQMIIPKKVGSC